MIFIILSLFRVVLVIGGLGFLIGLDCLMGEISVDDMLDDCWERDGGLVVMVGFVVFEGVLRYC